MMQKYRSLIANLKEHGFDHVFSVISWRLPDWLFFYNHSVHFKRDKTEIGTIDRDNYTFKIAKLEDYHLFGELKINENLFRQRLERGDGCSIAVKENSAKSLLWAAAGKLYIKNTGAILDTGENGFYIYNGFTIIEERSKGLYSATHNMLKQHFYALNRTDELCSIDVLNTNSILVHQKFGFKIVGDTVHFIIMGIRFCYYKKWFYKCKKLHVYFKNSITNCMYV